MFRIFRFGAGTYSIAVVLACTAFLLFQAYAHLKKKSSKEAGASVTWNPINSAHVLLVIIAVSCGIFLWSERFQFDHMDLPNGESYPVRINRLTGKSQVLYGGVWKPAAEVKSFPPLIENLSQDQLERLTGKGEIESMQGVFDLTLYNGSDFALREITIEITVRDSHQEEVLQRYYRIVQDHDYRQNGEYAQALDFSVGPQQSWSWKITAARGIKI